MIARGTVTFALLAISCSHEVRFASRAILWHDPDDCPTAGPFKRRNPEINWEGARDAIFRPADHLFGIDYGKEAINVNALDEVPDSSWFVDRHRDPTAPDDQPRRIALDPGVVERGPNPDPPVAPFVVLEGKPGASPGLAVRDSRGTKYLFKFDPVGRPHLVTSTEIVVSRLAWAVGWNVPNKTLVTVDRGDFQIDPKATRGEAAGKRVPITSATIDQLFGGTPQQTVLASQWLDGSVLGWFSYTGRDENDANDRVAHENRRDLRGFGVWAAWVDDVDTLENNTLDTYVGPPGQGHVVHYQLDVDSSFGVFTAKKASYWVGQETYFSPARILGSLATLGFMPRPSQDPSFERLHKQAAFEWPEFGFFDADHFDPRKWRPILDNPAFVRQTKRDRYWAAKKIVGLSEQEVRAAVRAGQYSADAEDHLFRVLWKRREKIARAYFSEVAPLDYFHFEGEALCFDDLWIDTGLGTPAEAIYLARERHVGRGSASLWMEGRCAHLGAVPDASRAYRVIELKVKRHGHLSPAVRVHVRERGRARHILGLERL